MDLTMPRMDGFAAAKPMRQNDQLKTFPHRDHGAPRDRLPVGAKASGFDAYVTKPIDVIWLKDLINGLLI